MSQGIDRFRRRRVQRIINKLKVLSVLCDEKYDINNGGCCYFAYLIAKKLERFKIKYKVIIYHAEKDDVEEILLNKHLYNGFYHVAIECCGQTINGFSYGTDYVALEITSRELNTLYKLGEWNDQYDVFNNETIKSLILC